MKRLLLAVAGLGLVISALRQVEARTDVSIDFFYENLGSGGNWVEVADYGYCWQPSVAVSNASWRPYTDGYWAYTDVGWTWVSYEDFGWATYHYGRWIRLRGRGWIWVPGRDWGPAWVSWRIGGDYVGWAPLPPRRGGEIFYDTGPIDSQVDVQLDIGPAFYNFIDIRYIGEPVLRERIFASDQNVTYITKTVNVTNITYTNSTVYNYGPDYNALSRFSTRPIQRLTLQRETNVDPIAAVRSNSLMKVHGDKLVIAAPAQLQKPPKPVAPKVVKEKIAQTPLERGWEPVGDAKAQAELKQKLKAEDPKTVLPPSFKPRDDAGQSPASSPAITANVPAAEASPASPETVTAPATLATSPGSSPSLSPPGKLRDAREEKPGPSVVPSPSPAPAASPAEKSKTERGNKPAATVPPSSTAPAAPPRPKRNPPSEDRERTSPPITPSTEGDQPIAPPSRDNGARKEKPAPINREVQPDSRVKRPMPPGPAEQPKREAPADIPQKRPPQERVGPPTGPVPNAPARPDGPRKGPDKNKPQSSPSPGQ